LLSASGSPILSLRDAMRNPAQQAEGEGGLVEFHQFSAERSSALHPEGVLAVMPSKMIPSEWNLRS